MWTKKLKQSCQASQSVPRLESSAWLFFVLSRFFRLEAFFTALFIVPEGKQCKVGHFSQNQKWVN